MKARPSRQELIDRMMRRVPNPEPRPNPYLSPYLPGPPSTQYHNTEPADEPSSVSDPNPTLTAFVEVGLSRHPLQCYRYTIYDMVRS